MIVILTQYAQSSGGGGGRAGARAGGGATNAFASRESKARVLRGLAEDRRRQRKSVRDAERRGSSDRWQKQYRTYVAETQAKIDAVRARPTIKGRKPERYATAFNF